MTARVDHAVRMRRRNGLGAIGRHRAPPLSHVDDLRGPAGGLVGQQGGLPHLGLQAV